MKFFNFGLFTLSAFIAISAAAPAPQSPAAITDDISKVPELSVLDGKLETRTDGHVNSLVKSCVGEVKKHTAKINSTMSGVTGPISDEDKAGVITLVHTEVTVIVSLVTNLCSEVLELVGTTLNAVEQEELVQLVLELIFEILYTLKNVIAILKISIFELLGNLIFGVLVAVGHLLVILNLIVDGLLKIVFGVLGDIIGLLSIVLSGLLPIVLGIVGGVLAKVGGIVSCIL